MKYEIYVRTIAAGPGFGPFMSTGEMGSRNAKPYIVEEAIALRLLGPEVIGVDPNNFASRYPQSALFGMPVLVDDGIHSVSSQPKNLQEQFLLQQRQIDQLTLMLKKRSPADESNIDHSILRQEDVAPKRTPTEGEIQAQREEEKKTAVKTKPPSLQTPANPAKPVGEVK